MIGVLAVAAGAALGAVLRSLAERVQAAALVRAHARHGDRWFVAPGWSTLVVNALGSALLGWAAGRHDAGALSTTWLLALGAGLAGGLTTFSTLGVELHDLLRERAPGRFVMFLVAHVTLGLGFATIAYRLACGV